MSKFDQTPAGMSSEGEPLSLLGQTVYLWPKPFEAFLAHQFLQVTAGTEIGMKLLCDQPARRVEAVLTAGMPIAFCLQLLAAVRTRV